MERFGGKARTDDLTDSQWIVNPTGPRKGLPLSSFRVPVRLLSARFPLKEQRSRPETPARGTLTGSDASDPQRPAISSERGRVIRCDPTSFPHAP